MVIEFKVSGIPFDLQGSTVFGKESGCDIRVVTNFSFDHWLALENKPCLVYHHHHYGDTLILIESVRHESLE